MEKYKLKSYSREEITIQDNSIQIKKMENKLNKLKDLYLDDLIDRESYSRDYKKYTNELNKLKTDVKVEKKDFSKVESIINSDYKTIYENLTSENKRRFWLSFIDKIYIEDGKIKEVTFL